jgi:hypothetical protein
MKISHKIALLWGSTISVFFCCLYFFHHRPLLVSSYLNLAVQSLLFLISVFIFSKEPNKKNKFIFLNFFVFFFVSSLQFFYAFVGVALLKDSKYAGHFYIQYVSLVYILLLSIAIGYLVCDLMFRESKIYKKYLLTAIIVLAFFIYYFLPFLNDPLCLYSTEKIKQWKTLSSAIKSNDEIPTASELASTVRLQAWRNGVPIADLYPDANLKRIEELVPYLEGDSYKVLLWEPVYLNTIYMDILIIGFILLFFGWQYKKDPPQGAYIDKIMFLFLLFVSTDILHQWGYIKSVELSSLTELFSIGQYITIVIQLIMVLFFSMRLKFITSPQGEFYETELAANPNQISRWRDWIDNMVLAHFFNFKIFNGRLFQNPTEK